MEDMYIKPGNQERGWNDPPQFSYGLQMARGPQRNPLNKRAAPLGAASGAPPMTPPSSSPLVPPPHGVAPPPLSPARPPPVGMAMPPPPLGPMRSQGEASSQSESEPDVDVVVTVLKQALAACRQAVKDQVCNDVAKRLGVLEDSWRTSPRLNRTSPRTRRTSPGLYRTSPGLYRTSPGPSLRVLTLFILQDSVGLFLSKFDSKPEPGSGSGLGLVQGRRGGVEHRKEETKQKR
ncbi:Steroid receptor RNA activator 1 [Larimichthys crocea]|uniref:Uncharacterized protein n=1 Tax=Larimichthys crocea TaxID=215358 RepID=A0ACD3R608_LARCR|nr:Steroid receptor RNA activator 1 [Larimichthys crocea]